MTEEANKALLNNINLLNIISHKIGCKDSNEAKQITYESFLRTYPEWDKTRGNLSTFICTVVRWAAIKLARQNHLEVRVPNYIEDIWVRLSRGSLDGTMEEFDDLKANGIHPFKHIQRENYAKILDFYFNGQIRRAFTDNMLDEFEEEDRTGVNDNLTKPETSAEEALSKERLNKFLDYLSTEHRYIIENYYGLNGNEPKTLEEMGNKLNLSKERIRTKKIQALAKMHNIAKYGDEKLTSERMVTIYLNKLSNNKKGR